MTTKCLQHLAVALGVAACAPTPSDKPDPESSADGWDCVLPDAPEPDSSSQIGCRTDFERTSP